MDEQDRPATVPGPDDPRGWYTDPELGTERWWNGTQWTQHHRQPGTRATITVWQFGGIWPAGIAAVLGVIGIWFAQTYRPTAANQLGLNGNTFYLKPGTYDVIMVAAIALVIGGVIRLAMILSSRRNG
jgi:hypothetical protein